MINKTKFENLEFIIADIKLQEKFANKIQKIEQQKSLYQEELKKHQENFDALLAQSFKS
jgi:type I restriction enzyme S subunit